MMFESNKLILSMVSDFIGQGYACNFGLFAFDATYKADDNVEYDSTSVYIVESSKM